MIPTSIVIARYYHSRSSLAEARYCRADWLRIDLPHDLADVLLLPTQCAARLDLLRVEYGFQQIFIEIHLAQIRRFQSNQVFAEFLQSQKLPFSCAFTRL